MLALSLVRLIILPAQIRVGRLDKRLFLLRRGVS
jgi:hypothetical protein